MATLKPTTTTRQAIKLQSKEIRTLGNTILENLGVPFGMSDLSVVTTSDFYVDIFLRLFPMERHLLNGVHHLRLEEDRTQFVIDALEGVLQTDLTHIRGSKIIMGHTPSIMHLLGLLAELSKSVASEQSTHVQNSFSKSSNRSIKRRPSSAVSRPMYLSEREQNNSRILPTPSIRESPTSSRRCDREHFNPIDDDFIEKNVKQVKGQLRNMKNYILPEDDRETTKKIKASMENYEARLRDFIQSQLAQEQANYRKQMIANTENRKVEEVLLKKLEMQMDDQIENQAKSNELRQRDAQAKKVREMNRALFKAEKDKIISEKREYNEARAQRNRKMRDEIESIENLYRDKISMLRDKVTQERKERKIAEKAQREAITRLQKEVRQEKKKKVDELQQLWNQRR
eukprot:TRINITY_DN6140_c0_g1_i3.p1 TRINITY_DN6140_c0_g1~~TRINITY_DN6140_c0_g1_i3.p1  ORF type:complete len:400 (-),score=83.39 TRINITY_DN6140_c0_g1_i3:133-1332(-)